MKKITSVIINKEFLLTIALFVIASVTTFQFFKIGNLEAELNKLRNGLQAIDRGQKAIEVALKTHGKTKIEFSESRKYEFQISRPILSEDFLLDYWNKIYTTTIGGFDEKFGFTEYVIEPFPYEGEKNEVKTFLRREGGLGSWYYNLRTKDGLDVNSKEKLLDLIGKIDSAAEAASLVYMTVPDLLVKDNILIGNTYQLPYGGFLVQVTNKNTFGCGFHDHTKSIYYVTEDGEVSLYVSELGREYDENDAVLCVD